jgi:poly(A) polymerase
MKDEAIRIVKKLKSNGYTAYFAGGCVRDLLLCIEPKDFDIATSATPDQIEELFANSIAVGKKYGVIKVVAGGKTIEVATFRSDLSYDDNRRPSKVKFSNPQEDAKRRDFTINGLFMDPTTGEIFDYVGGREDIKKKTIRFIGDASERINEDHLRLMRAIRFKTTLNFQYEKDTFEIVRSHAALIKNVSPERLRDELNLILKSKYRSQGLIELSESKLLEYVIPEIEDLKSVPQPDVYHKEGDVFVHIYLALRSLSEDAPLHLVWAVLLHDIAKPQTLIRENGRIIFHDHAQVSEEMAQTILKRLKFSNFEISDICWLIANHMKIGQIEKMRPSRRVAFLTDPKFRDLIELARADARGTYPINDRFIRQIEKEVASAQKQVEKSKGLTRKKLISGDDLVMMGLEPSLMFKQILEEIDDLTIAGKIKSKTEGIDYIKSRYL